MTTKYISIKSVLYDLSLTIDDRYWNEIKMAEWLSHGLRQLNIEISLAPKVLTKEVLLHKAQLPSDLKYLTQVAYYIGNSACCPEEDETIPNAVPISNTPTASWKPMRLTSNPYHESICPDNNLMYCTDCDHEFSVSPSLVLTTTLDSGIIMISYLAYPTDEEGFQMIPDDESLKEALLHYVLYRYWMSKYQMKEDGSKERVNFHLSMWQTLSVKSIGNLNLPDVNELENLKNQHNRILPRENKFQQMFLTLGNRENVKY